MVKRHREEVEDDVSHSPKRQKSSTTQEWFSRFSDELTLRVLSYLTATDLVVCQRLSSKYNALAGDGQLWKALYYDRFVRPRASRLPGSKEPGVSTDERRNFASKITRWLDDDHLVKRGRRTDWKRQYKLRHNWSSGNCAVNEIEVAKQVHVPPVLAQMHDGIIYVADRVEGLRAWSVKEGRKLIAKIGLSGNGRSHPTSISVDSPSESATSHRIALGFQDGSFSVYALDVSSGSFDLRYTHGASTNGVVSAVAVAWPFVVTMTATQRLSLYHFNKPESPTAGESALSPPILLHSLKSDTIWPPVSISVRPLDAAVVVSLAYCFETYLSGWTVGIQELRIDYDGRLVYSRLSSAIDQHYRPLAPVAPPIIYHLPTTRDESPSSPSQTTASYSKSRPVSLSYSHPYLLASHSDNTLALYLVTSTADSLSISAGSRLWGHTSSVSGAHVGKRGKAVSVSRGGDEIRVWELEGGFTSSAAKRRLATGELSVQVRPESASAFEQGVFDLAGEVSGAKVAVKDDHVARDFTLTRGWLGFDDESLVVLKEQFFGRQALVVYDFT